MQAGRDAPIGVVDMLGPDRAAGWVWQPKEPERRLSVSVLVNEVNVASVVADLYRPDLERANIGDGRHAFDIPFPVGALDTDVVRCVVEDADYEIPSGPKSDGQIGGAISDPIPLGGSLQNLAGRQLRSVPAHALTQLQEIFDDLILGWEPRLTEADQTFFQLDPPTRLEILQRSRAVSRSKVSLINLSGITETLFSVSSQLDSPPLLLHYEHILALLEQDLQEIFLSSLRSGESVLFKSPVDGLPSRADHCICIDEHRFIFRACDVRNRLVFYVLCYGTDCRTVGLYLPQTRTVFTLDDYHNNLYKDAFPCQDSGNIESTLLRHLCLYGNLLYKYLKSQTTSPVIFVPFFHLGHDLYNELSGLERMVSLVPSVYIPEVLVCRGERGSELYGRTEDILPELIGKIVRRVASADDLIRYCYEGEKRALRITRKFVSTSLRNRVIGANLASEELANDRERLQGFRHKRYPIILIGLRVENRTLVDLPEFCCDLIEFLESATLGCAVVIDGHVALNPEIGTAIFPSDSEERASKAPVQVEREIVALLSERFKGKRVDLVNNIGVPMRRALFWCLNSDFFVAIGGTGLAKYRWVCDRPGLILTNRKGTSYGDMRIWEPPVMEEATPVKILSAKYVQDMPGAPPLVDRLNKGHGGDEFFYNFVVDRKAVFDEVEQLLRRD